MKFVTMKFKFMLFHILIFISVIFLMWFLRNFRLKIISIFDVTILLTYIVKPVLRGHRWDKEKTTL